MAASCLLSCKENPSQNRDGEMYPETEGSTNNETAPEDTETSDSVDNRQSDSVTVGPASPKKLVEY